MPDPDPLDPPGNGTRPAPMPIDAGTMGYGPCDPGAGLPAAAGEVSPGDVLVNYEQVFTEVHGRYYQYIAQITQELAETRAAFKQAVAERDEARATADALRGIVND